MADSNQQAGIPFWGWPYGVLPNATTNPQAFNSFDANGNLNPNWEMGAQYMCPWDTAFIKGSQVPGLVRVTIKKETRRQKGKSPGYNHASIVLQGCDLAQVEMTIRIWTERQWYAYQKMANDLWNQLLLATKSAPATVPLANPIVGQTANGGQFSISSITIVPTANSQPDISLAAVDVQHPTLAVLGVTQLYILSVMPPVPSSTPGVMEAKFVFEEFAKPPSSGQSRRIKGAKDGAYSGNFAYGGADAVLPPSQNPASPAHHP